MSDSQDQTERYVGIEVSNTKYDAVWTDKTGKLIGSHEVVIDENRESFASLADFISDIRGMFTGFEKIGIAVPGLIDRKTQHVAFSTFIPEHEKKDFFAELENEAGVKLFVENDANAAAYGECMIGAGRGSRNMFYATLGTGVGGAFIFDGKIWHGASGFAGEFGHIAIKSEGMKLEDVASAANIVARTKNRFHQDDTSSLSRIGESDIMLEDIINAARNEDDLAIMMLERTGHYVGCAVATVINLLNIEMIVIGGQIMQVEDIVLDAIIGAAKESSFNPSFSSTKIVKGELGANASAIGAALLTSVL